MILFFIAGTLFFWGGGRHLQCSVRVGTLKLPSPNSQVFREIYTLHDFWMDSFLSGETKATNRGGVRGGGGCMFANRDEFITNRVEKQF